MIPQFGATIFTPPQNQLKVASHNALLASADSRYAGNASIEWTYPKTNKQQESRLENAAVNLIRQGVPFVYTPQLGLDPLGKIRKDIENTQLFTWSRQ